MTDKLTVLVTVPNKDCALEIARNLVKERLAACVNIVPQITSVYEWDGEMEEADELLLICKTRSELFSAIEKRVQELHPYEVPEIIGHSIDVGSLSFLQWVDQSLVASKVR